VLLLLLALCFLPALCGSSVQAEAMYQISEGELNQLQSNLTELKADSEKKQSLLTEQQKQLQIVNEQLEKSRALNEETQSPAMKTADSAVFFRAQKRIFLFPAFHKKHVC
jgi:TolA-binding protein